MLTRALVSVLAAGLAAVLMLAAGNLVGSVTCGQSYSPQCDVTAGSGPSAGTRPAVPPALRIPPFQPAGAPGFGKGHLTFSTVKVPLH